VAIFVNLNIKNVHIQYDGYLNNVNMTLVKLLYTHP